MAEVGVIGKDRKNPQQGYQFRGIDDVLAVLQPLFIKHGVVCLPKVLKAERELLDTKSGGKMASVRLLVEHTFFCAADGSSVYATTYGEAMDSGDKASNKAMSAALKYALTESFSIPTKESDRDTEEQSPELAPKPDAPRTQSGTRPQTVPASKPGTSRPAPKPSGNLPTHFGNFGNAKGQAIQGQDEKTLRYYMHACERTLADQSKSRFHDKEKLMLAAIQAELAKFQRMTAIVNGAGDSGMPSDEPPPPGDEDAPF